MIGLSELDPNSFSRPDECIVTHLHLDVDVDFVDRKLRGSVKMDIRKVMPLAKRLVSVSLSGGTQVVHVSCNMAVMYTKVLTFLYIFTL